MPATVIWLGEYADRRARVITDGRAQRRAAGAYRRHEPAAAALDTQDRAKRTRQP